MRTKLWLSGLGLLAACGSNAESGPDPAIGAHISAIAAKLTGGTTFMVTFYDLDSLESATMAKGDRLSARFGEHVVQLEAEDTSDAPSYIGVLRDDAPGTTFEVVLESEQWGDAHAELTLPDPVTLTAPARDDSPDLEAPITVEWEGGNAGDTAEATALLNCGNGTQLSQASKTDAEGDRHRELEFDVHGALQYPCDLQVDIARKNLGTMDGAWSGTAEAIQGDLAQWHIE
jgi:hypothetical protein